MEKNSEFAALREEVLSLKSEVERLRSGAAAKNEQLKVAWVSGAVAELRSELAEISASVNVTELRSRGDTLGEEVRVVRSDVIAVRRDVDVLRAQTEARVSVLADDLRDLAVKCRVQHKKDSRITPAEDTPEDNKKYRHQRLLKKKMETLTSAQARLELQVQRLEKKLQTPAPVARFQRVTDNEVLEEDLALRVSQLENENRKTAKSLFNITRQVAGLSKLHVSMLELLESVESLEAKVDDTVPSFRKEISRLEFSLAQLTSTVSITKEDQENQRSMVKAMGEAMSTMQEKVNHDHARLAALSEKKASREVPLTLPQHSERLSGLVERLTHVVQDYDSIVADLPHDCSWVNGPSGLYIVAPGKGTPLVTFCDQTTGAGGWTLVQRRQDGSQDFNNNWQQYAKGFGSALGEFWIGNEALHRLTAANESSLRVDLVDIYGKAWYAEYDQFSVGNASDGYRLNVAGYHGNASDALDYQNHMQFSAIDSDRDVSNTHCAANYEGGWWFSHCQHANLNGRYNLGLTWFDAGRNEWIAVARSEMKVRSRRHRGNAQPAAA
ncbi:protein scabrous-like [Macrosteles quadrilineatus]|uniref:protein scabrous-like n=1 Tax=Macrosteles quadrilineatus TaxID=74068 RepID=UPI0023E345C9|nr:protein scabrous-like [Macrosteles quadrilineatus]